MELSMGFHDPDPGWVLLVMTYANTIFEEF
jgi:hypothetical protein